MAHYNRNTFTNALIKVGIKKGDIVFSHSNIGYFGMPEGDKTKENSFNTIIDSFFSVLGDAGTLVVPTFTYSFSNGEEFDPNNTPSNCGFFSEMFRQHPDAIRSKDPCVSVAAIGKRAREMVENVGSNTYDEKGFFHRFYKANGKICNMNFDSASTFIHYVERALQVPYRFDKTFKGILKINGLKEEIESTIFVRCTSSDQTVTVFEPFDKFAKEQGLCQTVYLNRGVINMITAQDTYNLIEQTLPNNPWFLTQSGLSGIVPILTPERY